MARAGIYANGKEIVARYFGDKLVWKKEKWVEVGHFDRFNDWEREGDTTLVRRFSVRKNYNDTQQADYNYNATKARVNGKPYDITLALMNVQDLYREWYYSFYINFKNRSDRDEVFNMYQPDIYLYRKE